MIFAGIVCYEPDIARLRENLEAVTAQVDRVVLYDNGSSNLGAIDALVQDHETVHLLAGRENCGIAAALNRIAEFAVEKDGRWLVTLDQDSVCSAGMVEALRHEAAGDIAIVTPFIVDRNKLSVDEYTAMTLPRVEYFSQAARRGAITSGSLVSLRVWAEVAGYDERFFIDYVDYDFNQRVMDAGYRIARVNGTFLIHEVGMAGKTWLRIPRKDLSGRWRLERFYSFGHSPQRCYFKARNRVLFTRKHARRIGITHEGIWQIPQQIVLTLLFETQRVAKLRAFASGIRDGIRFPLDQETDIGTELRGPRLPAPKPHPRGRE